MFELAHSLTAQRNDRTHGDNHDDDETIWAEFLAMVAKERVARIGTKVFSFGSLNEIH